jgi:hypothetical protein
VVGGRLVASLMMANGLLVWPLGVLLAWFAGHSRARLGALLAGGLLVFAFYLHDYESQGAFAREARHPSAPAADGRWPFWVSCVNGDEDTGRLELAPVPAPESRVLAVPFLTGPSTQGLSLEIVDPDRQTGVARMAAVEASADAWHAWVVRLPEATQRVVLVAEDRGKGWGQWIAVGPPCALGPAAARLPLQPDRRAAAEGDRARLPLCGRAQHLDQPQGGDLEVQDQGDGVALPVHHPLLLAGEAALPA